MKPTQFLRIEGFAVLVGALVLYYLHGGPVWLLLVLGLAPDISMFGYVLGPRRGSLIYNLFHTYVFPLLVGGVAMVFGNSVGLWAALIWIGHIGADRLFGYGLKFDTGFTDTHLSAQPIPTSSLAEWKRDSK